MRLQRERERERERERQRQGDREEREREIVVRERERERAPGRCDRAKPQPELNPRRSFAQVNKDTIIAIDI